MKKLKVILGKYSLDAVVDNELLTDEGRPFSIGMLCEHLPELTNGFAIVFKAEQGKYSVSLTLQLTYNDVVVDTNVMEIMPTIDSFGIFHFAEDTSTQIFDNVNVITAAIHSLEVNSKNSYSRNEKEFTWSD